MESKMFAYLILPLLLLLPPGVLKAQENAEALSIPYTVDFSVESEGWEGERFFLEGNRMLFVPSVSSESGLLFSPAVRLSKGAHRVSFYYHISKSSSELRLQLLMGRERHADGETSMVAYKTLEATGNKLQYSSNWVEVDEDGVYYFMFKAFCGHPSNNGGKASVKGAVYVYEGVGVYAFSVDDNEDVGLDEVSFDTGSGEGKIASFVTLTLTNHGRQPQQPVKVAYWVDGDEASYFEEDVAGPVPPGKRLRHKFSKAADISTPDSYYDLRARLVTRIGDDHRNDTVGGGRLYHFGPRRLPYECDFQDRSYNGRWTLAGNGSWQFGFFMPYVWDLTDRVLCHRSRDDYAEEDSDDWAFSEPVHLERGDYEFSFFHRGAGIALLSDSRLSFEVFLCKLPQPESAGQCLVRHEGVYDGRPSQTRDVAPFHVDEDGDYYIGFHDYSPRGAGETIIESLSVKAVERGLSLPFQSDFSNGLDGWTRYNDYGFDGGFKVFAQWVEDGGGMVAASATVAEGLLVTPKLLLPARSEVDVTVEYGIESADDTLGLCLYRGELNAPDMMRVIARGDGASHVLRHTIQTGDSDEECYLGVRSSAGTADKYEDLAMYASSKYTLRVNSLSVSADPSGIVSVMADDPDTRIYDAAGMPVSHTQQGHLYIRAGKKFVAK